MRQYYKTDITRLTFGELWRLAPGPAFLFAAVIKILNIKLAVPNATCRVDKLIILEPATMSKVVRPDTWKRIEECHALGFNFEFWYTVPLIGGEGYGAVLSSPDRRTIAHVIYSRTVADLIQELTIHCFQSRARDGSPITTGAKKQQMMPTPGEHVIYRPGFSVAQTWDEHKDFLNRLAAQTVPMDRAAIEQFLVDVSNRDVDFNIERGVYVPMTEAEVRELRLKSPPSPVPGILVNAD
ncbi:MAG TPA: hypothetical protein VEK08_19295 [Planctomycetota bacterium]|nr:hypothetical protein [Planctomycetota bacterium]